MSTFYYVQIDLWWGARWDTLIHPSKRRRWCHNSVPGCFFWSCRHLFLQGLENSSVRSSFLSPPAPPWSCGFHDNSLSLLLSPAPGKGEEQSRAPAHEILQWEKAEDFRVGWNPLYLQQGWVPKSLVQNRLHLKPCLCILIFSFSMAGNTIHKEKVMTWGNLILWG